MKVAANRGAISPRPKPAGVSLLARPARYFAAAYSSATFAQFTTFQKASR